MLTLTTPVTIPNITKLRVNSPVFDDDNSLLTVRVDVQIAGALVVKSLACVIGNGSAQGVRANPSPLNVDDRVQVFTQSQPTGYTDAVAAYNAAGGGVSAKCKAIETYMLGVGLLPAGTVA